MKNLWPALAVSAVLSACGGGSDSAPAASNGAGGYGAVLAQLNSAAGLTGPGLDSAFDNAYLDSGMTKPQVADALSQEGAALAAAPEHSLFPQVALSNVSVTACDSNNLCTMTGTLTNVDGDGTSVDFSTKVINSNGSYRLLGDQQAG